MFLLHIECTSFTWKKELGSAFTFDGTGDYDEEDDEEIHHSEKVVRQRRFLGSEGERG